MRYLLLLFLTGCAFTAEQKADRAISRHGPYCERIGFEKGSDGWRNCVFQRDAQRRGTVCQQVGNTLVCN